MSEAATRPQSIPVVLLWLGMAAAVVSFVGFGTWRELPHARALELLILAGVVALAAWPLRRWAGWPAATSYALVWSLPLMIFAGPVPVLAGVLIALTALALGSSWVPDTLPARAVLAIVAGLAVLAGTLGWLLPLPIHRIWVHLPLLLGIVFWRRHTLRDWLVPLCAEWRDCVSREPRVAAFIVMVAGLVSTSCWLPTLQYDDLAYHLGLPAQLQELGYYRLDAASQVWALAPWLGDVLQGLAQLIAGGQARGAVNALWLVLTCVLLWQISAGLRLPAWGCWIAVALYISQPIVASLVGGMQAEGPGTAGLLALTLVVQRAPDQPNGAILRLAALLAGVLLGLKLAQGLAVMALGLWLLWRWRGRLPWRALPFAVLLAVFVAGSSYVYAWTLTGNPVLPLFNAWFGSSWFPHENFFDARWLAGFDWRLPWRMSFDSSAFNESWDGVAGFGPIALLGALPFALISPRARPLALIGLVLWLVPLSQIQYLRYAHPATALLLPALLAGAGEAVGRRMLLALGIGLSGVNLAYQANASWILRGGGVKHLITKGRDVVIQRTAPERHLVAYLREHHDRDVRVLFTASPYAAELAGIGFVADWYDPRLFTARAAAEADATGDGWRKLLGDYGFTHVVLNAKQASAPLRAALAVIGAESESTSGTAELWRLPQPPAGARDLSRERDFARQWR